MLDEKIKLNEINLREESVWGARNIAYLAGCSVDFIYTMANDPDCPISKPGGRYFTLKTPFIRYLTAKKPHLARTSQM